MATTVEEDGSAHHKLLGPFQASRQPPFIIGVEGGSDIAHPAFLRCRLLHSRHSTWPCSWSRVRSKGVPQIEHQGWARRARLEVAAHRPAYWVRAALRAF
jgi:hypothetical protein